VLNPKSRARLATLDAVGAHLVLESGAADVHVTPNHGARYRVSLGPFAVDVTGTRFDVGFRPSDELFTLNLLFIINARFYLHFSKLLNLVTDYAD